MESRTELIKTANQIIDVQGKVFYNDRRRRIDIKKPIRNLFGRDDTDVFYTMELCLSRATAVNRVNELSESDIVPVLLYFRR